MPKSNKSGTKRRISKRSENKKKTVNETSQQVIDTELRTTHRGRSELQSVLNIGTVGKLTMQLHLHSWLEI